MMMMQAKWRGGGRRKLAAKLTQGLLLCLPAAVMLAAACGLAGAGGSASPHPEQYRKLDLSTAFARCDADAAPPWVKIYGHYFVRANADAVVAIAPNPGGPCRVGVVRDEALDEALLDALDSQAAR